MLYGTVRKCLSVCASRRTVLASSNAAEWSCRTCLVCGVNFGYGRLTLRACVIHAVQLVAV